MAKSNPTFKTPLEGIEIVKNIKKIRKRISRTLMNNQMMKIAILKNTKILTIKSK
jgi:hypothetical protein